MKLVIYVEHRFAVLTDYYDLTIKANDNDSLLVSYKHSSTSWIRKYEKLNELIDDGDLIPLWKWIARGILGIPLDIVNQVIKPDELPKEFFDLLSSQTSH
jgi:hypothetical protein